MFPSSLSVGTVPVQTPVQTTFIKYIYQGASMVKKFSVRKNFSCVCTTYNVTAKLRTKSAKQNKEHSDEKLIYSTQLIHMAV